MPYVHDSRAIVTRPIFLASSKKGTAAALVRFSTTYLWTDLARQLVGRFEHFLFLFLALFC